jgi:hypothetical protein
VETDHVPEIERQPSEKGQGGVSLPAPVSDESEPMDLSEHFPDYDLPDLVVERHPAEEIASGRRVVDLPHVLAQMKRLALHCQKCTGGDFQLIKERRNGLASFLDFQCFSCGRQRME